VRLPISPHPHFLSGGLAPNGVQNYGIFTENEFRSGKIYQLLFGKQAITMLWQEISKFVYDHGSNRNYTGLQFI